MLTFEKMRPEERDTCAALAARAFGNYEYFTYYIPHNEALGQLKRRKVLYLQRFLGFGKAQKIHLYIKLTSNGVKTDAEVEKSHNVISDLERTPLSRSFFAQSILRMYKSQTTSFVGNSL